MSDIKVTSQSVEHGFLRVEATFNDEITEQERIDAGWLTASHLVKDSLGSDQEKYFSRILRRYEISLRNAETRSRYWYDCLCNNEQERVKYSIALEEIRKALGDPDARILIIRILDEVERREPST